jgi:flagellar biogenesis protein FliO
MFATLPTSSVADITNIMGGIFTDFKGLIFLILGIVIGLWVLNKIVNLTPKDEYWTDEEGFYHKKNK